MKYLLIIIGLAGIFIAVIIIEIIVARQNPPEDFQNPSPEPVTLGWQGQALSYVVTGDSTAAGQGADYEEGIAMRSARHLADDYQVTLVNLGVSGAKTADVTADQLPQAVALKPDVVLISIGANDVTSLTSPDKAKKELAEIIDSLIAANCDVKIVITGAPDMGSVPRFAQPLRWLAGLATERLNDSLVLIVKEKNITLAPIAAETGPVFRQNPDLFANDKFHPDANGYEIWTNTINPALDEALALQPSHCSRD